MHGDDGTLFLTDYYQLNYYFLLNITRSKFHHGFMQDIHKELIDQPI